MNAAKLYLLKRDDQRSVGLIQEVSE